MQLAKKAPIRGGISIRDKRCVEKRTLMEE